MLCTYEGVIIFMAKLTKEQFVERSEAAHGKHYDYSKVEYKNTKTKVCIVCPEHGEFFQKPEKHMLGQGCPLCASAKLEKTNLERYGVRRPLQADNILSKMYKNNTILYGVINPGSRPESVLKRAVTKRLNRTFNTSKSEEALYKMLCEVFGEEDVLQQYRSEVYPFACDFYIKSRDMYIELNGTWTHGDCWYDSANEQHNKIVELWQRHGTSYYKNAVDTWTGSDVRKRATAREHSLNYVVFWKSNLSDAKLWFAEGCKDRQDYEEN